jgi:UDP-N-acetylmuramoyl-tripeptide--D-alanyl-D-alanine ligase
MQQAIDKLFEIFLTSTGVTIDNRTISGGEIFFGLKGERANGGAFAKAALDKGAICCVVDDVQYQIDNKCIVVEDVLLALQLLAKKYRDTFAFPVLALTGSNGKTTTKELIAAVLATKYRVSATKGNLNNHIGVPLTLLSIKRDCNFAVIEMGANHQKEIASYCTYASPDFALITNIGKAHLEGFGGEAGVLKGKSELFEFVQQKNGTLFINSSESALLSMFVNHEKIIKYGFNQDDNTIGKIISDDEFAKVFIDNHTSIKSHLVGDYNANNIIAAACIGKYFGITLDAIKSAIETYIPDNNRSELKLLNGNYFIMDAYNANPSSMKAALNNFEGLKATNKIVIIGDMLELGEYTNAEHQAIIDLVLKCNFDQAVTVGPLFASHATSGILHFQSATDAKVWFDKQQFNGATILLKGSRGMKLETIIA